MSFSHEKASDASFSTGVPTANHHRFCLTCGIATHSHGLIDAMGGDFMSVHLAALDDLPVSDLIAAPLHYMDGLHDNWQNSPKETRHL